MMVWTADGAFRKNLGWVALGALMLAGCASGEGARKDSSAAPTGDSAARASGDMVGTAPGPGPGPGPEPGARAMIEARSGSEVSGSALFFALPDNRTRVVVTATGLKPGPHGIHLHEKGDCTAPDAASAGGHWNPHNAQHGGPMDSSRHPGDLGNIMADADGKATLTFESADFQLAGPMSVVGRAIVLHEKVDDLVSQPAGNSGARIGCGVVVAP